MDKERVSWLLDGGEPNLDDYVSFLALCERASMKELWEIVNQKTKMHWILRSAVIKVLQEKITQEKREAAVQSMSTKLADFLRDKIK